MSIFKDVVVNIQRLTSALAAPNYGLCLILTTEDTVAYGEYSSLTAVAEDYVSTKKAYKIANAIFSQDPAPDKVAIVGIKQSEAFSEVIDGLNLLINSHDGFTYFVSDETAAESLAALASWATANKKFYGATIGSAQVGTIANPESDYVFYFVSDALPAEYPEAAFIAKCSSYQLGSATWMFKTLNGITPSAFDDQATMVGLINTNHYNAYVSKYGINMTTGGYLTSGEYIDVMLGVFWIQKEMELRIQQLLANTAKVPYDNGGIALIAAQVDATLREATTNSIIRKNEGGLGEYTISIPDVSNISSIDIANRELKGIYWQAYLAGAIHHVVINGLVQY